MALATLREPDCSTYTSRMAKRPRRPLPERMLGEMDTFMDFWLSLTPAERLRRSWAMRSRLRDPAAIHDAKLFPRP